MHRLRAVLMVTAIVLGLGAAARSATNDPVPGNDMPPGTKITTQNWQHYKQFMSQGMIALFEGSNFWRMPGDVVIEVGQTKSIPPPAKYLQDTRQSSSNVSLMKLSTGGYVPVGYTAGVPFPDPFKGEPALTGERIFWNSFYRYQPRVQGAPNYSYTLDRAGNMTQSSESTNVQSQLVFLSDPGLPQTIPEAGRFYLAKFNEQVSPEQSKYTTILDLLPSDPTQLDELYEYVPTLRRSLRLSQAARCAPVFGSDYVIDDENNGPPGLPQLFKVEYLGEKKILALEHADPRAFDSAGTSVQLEPRYFYPGGAGIVPFPKPAIGQWELRDTYVISLERLPQFAAGYCYGKRVMYVDKENYFGGAQLDLYDTAGQLYKSQMIISYPQSIPGTEGDVAQLISGSNTSFLINFKDKHLSIDPSLRSCVNSDCAKDGYLDVSRYASPEGLAKIVQ